MTAMPRRTAGTGSAPFQRADGRWATKLTIGRRGGRQVQRWFYGATPREVERKRDDAVRQLAGGVILAGERVTVARYLADWLAVKRPPAVRESTWRRYRQIVELNIVPVLGHVPLSRLTPAAVERALAVMPLSQRTRHHVRAVLRTALERAVRHGMLERNVARLAEPPKVEAREQLILDVDQVHALLAATSEPRLRAILSLAIATAMRQGEVLGLRWRDVDLETGSLRVVNQLQRGDLVAPKTKRSRRALGIPPSTVAVLRSWQVEQERLRRFLVRTDWPDRHGLVFTTQLGRPLDGTNVTHAFQRALAAAGLPRMSFHGLRHTASSLMLAGGADLKVVQQILGHSQLAMAAHYTQALPSLLRQTADRMEAVVG
jgi:integrase